MRMLRIVLAALFGAAGVVMVVLGFLIYLTRTGYGGADGGTGSDVLCVAGEGGLSMLCNTNRDDDMMTVAAGLALLLLAVLFKPSPAPVFASPPRPY